MKPIASFFRSLRDFWANDQQRKTLMWVIAAVGTVVLVYGVVQIVQGQIDYQHRSDDLDKTRLQITAFEAQFPTGTDAAGVIKPDLSTATQDQLLMLATFKKQERDAENKRIDAYNKRAIGIRIAGVGVIGLALAYLVSPTPKKPETPAPDAESDQPPSDLPPE
jgi:hypothetical protein